jgi:hypothetical protein
MAFGDGALQQHYRLLLGIEAPWRVEDVKLEMADKKVEIRLSWTEGAKARCPECGQDCGVYDHAPERVTGHFKTGHSWALQNQPGRGGVFILV